MDPGLLALLTAVAGITGAAATWLVAKRRTSGKISTSDAATLWAASEKIRTDQAVQLDKVSDQRDRLIESQTTLILPLLQGINTAVGQITESLARLEKSKGNGG